MYRQGRFWQKGTFWSRLLESETNVDNLKEKRIIVDVLCKIDNDELVVIEVQFYYETDFFQRILYGTSKILTEHLKVKKPYKRVKKIYSVNLVYFKLGQGLDYVYHGFTEFTGMNQNDTLKLSEIQKNEFGKSYPGELYPEYYILKINDYDNIARTQLDDWIYYFKNSEIPKNCKSKTLSLLSEKLKVKNMSVKEQEAYKKHLKSYMVSEASLKDTYKLGY
ncbi:MAG: PD-(D/E)XK nuclease family transposase, partial [Cryomorphaceae bacterium]|nr:PD-(D/E)XK nuclease family transposase [Cryomorphaceae bacterium]